MVRADVRTIDTAHGFTRGLAERSGGHRQRKTILMGGSFVRSRQGSAGISCPRLAATCGKVGGSFGFHGRFLLWLQLACQAVVIWFRYKHWAEDQQLCLKSAGPGGIFLVQWATLQALVVERAKCIDIARLRQCLQVMSGFNSDFIAA